MMPRPRNPVAGKSQTVYLDRTLELIMERWARAHRLTKKTNLQDGSIVTEADFPAAIVAILREFLRIPGYGKDQGFTEKCVEKAAETYPPEPPKNPVIADARRLAKRVEKEGP